MHYICIDSKSLLPAPGRRFVPLDREDHDAMRWLGDLVMFWSSSWSWRATFHVLSHISCWVLGSFLDFLECLHFFLLGEGFIFDSYCLTWLTTPTLLDITVSPFLCFFNDLFCGAAWSHKSSERAKWQKKDELIFNISFQRINSYVGCGLFPSPVGSVGNLWKMYGKCMETGSPPSHVLEGGPTGLVQVGPPIPTRSLHLGRELRLGEGQTCREMY